MTKDVQLAEKIKVKRHELGLSQADLARKSGLAQATISRLESGEVTQLKSDKLAGLARALRVSVDFLVSNAERMEFDEALRTDERANVIFRGYEKLSEGKRRELLDYVKFLIMQEKDDKG